MRRSLLVPTLAILGALALACGDSDEASDDGTATPPPPTPTQLSGSGTESDPYKAECIHNGKDLTGNVGDSFYVTCPGDCTTGSVWGTGPYTRDSRLCTAAIHGGAIPASGGTFKAGIAAGQASYEGSAANGITSSSWGSYDTSLTVAAAAPPAPKVETPEAPKEAPVGPKPVGPGKVGKLGRPH